MQTPCLHIRQGGSDCLETRKAPFSQSGRLVAMDGDWIVMQTGRTTMSFFIPDFFEIFGDAENTRRLLGNALEHRDFVEFHVMKTRLAYQNEAQYARVLRAYPASEV